MMKRMAGAALWLALSGVVLAPTAQEIAAQAVVCFKKKCVIFPDGTASCQYTQVDCSQVNIQ
jgi:hypothetical protein